MTIKAFKVSAPATSGNLGPGFDVFGMALELRSSVTVRKGSGQISINGYGADEFPTDERNLIARTFKESSGQSIKDAGVDLQCMNRIPPARGLGASTAAAACGYIAGWEIAGVEWDEALLSNKIIELEGHPDNAAACAYGGIVLCHDRPEVGEKPSELDIIPLGTADWLQMLVLIPERALPADASRLYLPSSYDRQDVISAIGGSALLAAGLIGGHLELLSDALDSDVLHEKQRSELIPELSEVREALTITNALGATVSGAGPSVLIWCDQDSIDQTEGTLGIEFPDHELLRITISAAGAMRE